MGKFEIGKTKLLAHIYGLSKNSEKGCTASTEYLSKALGISTRQVFRYLKSLKDDDKIRVITSDTYTTVKTKSGFTNDRSIYLKCEASDQIKEIRRKYCKTNSEDINKRKETNKIKKQTVKNQEKLATITNTELPNVVWYNPPPDYSENHDFVSTLPKETKELVEKTLEEERLQREIESDNLTLKKEIIKWQGVSEPTIGETNREKLINAYLKHHTRTVERLKNLGIYESVRSHQVLPPEVLSKENGEYYIDLSIPTDAGTIDFKIKLFEYVSWREDSWEYKEMEKALKGK